MKLKISHKNLYWGLIVTFAVLYFCVGFVSTLHSITFFHLANATWLSVLLGLTYEVGQASVLFSILMTKNRDKFLPWALMILLTSLQVTANVYASFKFMVQSGSNDWQFWQKSILFGVQAENSEMYQMIISWIAGALLPIVALGMTSLVADNIKMMTEENEEKEVEMIPKEKVDEIVQNEVERRYSEGIQNKVETKVSDPIPPLQPEDRLENFARSLLQNQGKMTVMEEKPIIGEGGVQIIRPQMEVDIEMGKVKKESAEKRKEELNQEFQKYLDEEVERLTPVVDVPTQEIKVEVKENKIPVDVEIEEVKPEPLITKSVMKEAEKATIKEVERKPITKMRGWHLKQEYVDSNGDVYHFGKYSPLEKRDKPELPKKA